MTEAQLIHRGWAFWDTEPADCIVRVAWRGELLGPMVLHPQWDKHLRG